MFFERTIMENNQKLFVLVVPILALIIIVYLLFKRKKFTKKQTYLATILMVFLTTISILHILNF